MKSLKVLRLPLNMMLVIFLHLQLASLLVSIYNVILLVEKDYFESKLINTSQTKV